MISEQHMSRLRNIRTRLFSFPAVLFLTALLISACVSNSEDKAVHKPNADLALLQTLPVEPISFTDEVSPVLDRRCVVCHGCYDAPCQLKLSSVDGVSRGASKEKVYVGARFKSMAGRFSKPVFPGESLTVSMWVNGGEALFRTTSSSGVVVIDQGRCRFDS